MRSKPGLTLVLCFFILCRAGFSQVQPANSNYNAVLSNTGQFGLTFGPAIYHGDLNVGNFTFKRSTGLAASLFGQYYFSNVFGFRVSLFSGILNGGVKSYVKNGQQTDDSFTGLILEGDLHMVVNFSNLFFRPGPKRKFFVYGIVGLGFGGWYSKLTNKVYNYDSLQYDNPLSNFNASLVIPVGLGCYYRIGNRLNIGMEYSYKTYFSDKLDNVTGGYPYDAVHYISLNISFNLGTGSAKEHGRRPGKSPQLQPADYPMSYPVNTQVYSPPPEARPAEQVLPVMEYPRVEKSPVKPQPRIKPGSREVYCYAVQIFAFDQHRYTAGWITKHYHITEGVRMEKSGSVERFVVGKCADLECARDLREKMQRKGIHDAFIVAYQNGKRHHTIK